MKPAETSIITIRRDQAIIHMSIVQKQSDTGLLFNQRLFILQQGLFFGYISKFDIKNNPQLIDTKKVKTKIPTKLIKSVNYDKENLVIKFLQIQNNKQQLKKWVFKMASSEMITNWYRILQQEKTRKNSKSQEKLNLSPKKYEKTNEKQIQKPEQKRLSKNKEGEQNQKKNKEPQQIIEQQSNQNRQFVNPLYTGYESIDSGPTRNALKNTKVLQTPKSGLNLQFQQKKTADVPLRENNHMQLNFKKQQQVTFQIDLKNKNEKDQNKRKLEFKNDKDSFDKLRFNDKQKRNSSFEDNSQQKSTKRQSYVEMIQKIVKQSEERAMEKYKQRALQKQYEGDEQNRKHFYNNVLQEFIRYQPGETAKWKEQNWKKYYQSNTNSRNNSQLEVFQQQVLNILHKQRENNIKKQKSSQIKLNDFSKQIAQMIKNKRLERQGGSLEEIQQDNIYLKSPKIDIKNMAFSYRYLLAVSPNIPIQQRQEDELELLNDWKNHCQNLMKKIISDIASNSGKYIIKKKKNNILHLQVDQILVKIACSSLKTIAFNQKQSKKSNQSDINRKQEKITDYSAAKDLQIEFNNYYALNQLLEQTQHQNKKQLKNSSNIEHHSSRLKVPLTAIVEYSGFVGLFKLNIKLQKDKTNIDLVYLKEKQQLISHQLNIGLNWVENANTKYNFGNESQDYVKSLIFHVDENYYLHLNEQRYGRKGQKNKSNTAQKEKDNKIFSIDIIHQVGSCLIKDYLTKSLSNGVLRKQLMLQLKQKDQYQSVKFVNPSSITDQNERSKLQADLTLLSGEILQKLSHLILRLDSFQANYMHPTEISSIFHSLGINIRYMGLAYDNLNEVYAKKNLMTEIAARVVKLILRKSLQDIVIENQHKKRQLFIRKNDIKIENETQEQIQPSVELCSDVIDFLNCILGSSHQSDIMWKLLSQHAQFYFKCQLNKNFIDPGYFVISLAYHCKLQINWKNLKQIHQSMFKTQQFFNSSTLVGIKPHAKTYEPGNSKIIKTLKQIINPLNNKDYLSKLSQQIINQIVQKLQLKTNPFPPCLQCLENQSPFSILSLKQMFSHFVRPQTIKLSKSQSSFSHLQVFKGLNQFPQTKSFHIKIQQIKWYLKLKNKQKYLKKFQQLINLLNKFYGDFCPLLSEVYQIFTNFHLQNGQYEDAITFCKSSSVNTMKTCGVNHIKTGEAYCNLAHCYLKTNKIQDAYGLFKKAKEVYESKQKTSCYNYAIINLKLGLLMLNKNQVKKSLQSIQKSLQIFNLLPQIQCNQGYSTKQLSSHGNLLYEDQKVECYEALLRCYQATKDMHGLKSLSSAIKQSFLENIKQVSNLQKILRVILFPHLQSITNQDRSKYIELTSHLTGLINSFQITPKNYNKVLTLIKKRIKQKSLVNNFENYVDNLSSIFDYIQINNSIQNWKPFEQEFQRQTINDFIAITQELILFLGDGYLTGALRDNLQN